MTTGLLFQRDYLLTVGTIDLTGLDCSFKVKRTLKPEPNTCELKIWNLSEATRLALVGKGNPITTPIPIRLEAGYLDRRTLLYLGDVRDMQTSIEGPNVITEFNSGDKEKTIATSRMNIPTGAQEPVGTTLNNIAKALGVGAGNLSQAQSILAAKGIATFYPRAGALCGSVSQRLTDLCNSANLEWSVQNGALQILDRGKPLQGNAILLDTSSGLVGSPKIDNKGIVSAKSLMHPDIRPGVKVKIESESVKGAFRVREVETSGDTRETDWYTELKGERH